MRRMLAALALILLPASPALADWGHTRWGMTPEEVIAVVPGAKPFDLVLPDSLSHNVLVDATTQDGGIEFWTHYYFKHPEKTLTMIRSMMNDPRHCGDYRDMLVARLGKAKVYRTVREDRGWKQRSIQMVWIDRSTGDATNFAITFADTTEREYSECELNLYAGRQ